jgi:hypothetical protein
MDLGSLNTTSTAKRRFAVDMSVGQPDSMSRNDGYQPA